MSNGSPKVRVPALVKNQIVFLAEQRGVPLGIAVELAVSNYVLNFDVSKETDPRAVMFWKYEKLKVLERDAFKIGKLMSASRRTIRWTILHKKKGDFDITGLYEKTQKAIRALAPQPSPTEETDLLTEREQLLREIILTGEPTLEQIEEHRRIIKLLESKK